MSVVPVNKAYRLNAKTGDAINIGDSADTVFHPKVTLNRWNNECWLKFGFDDSKIAQRSVQLTADNKVQWSTPLFDFRFYGIDEGDGGLEFEIILKQKPPTNKFTFFIQTQNLKFYYQPPLTQEFNPVDCVELSETYARLKNGEEIWRPENVVGSYAVYHVSKRNNQYKTGKAFHIYRPKLSDADDKTAWADLNFDELNGALTITLPQAFLDSAKYPVVVDPTFGYTSIGATEDGTGGSAASWTSQATLPENGSVTKITAYLRESAAGGSKAKFGLYNDSANDPNALQATSSEVVLTTTWEWRDFTCEVNLQSGEYWLAEFHESNSRSRWDSVAGKNSAWKWQDYASAPPNPYGSHNDLSNRVYSFYATYTPSAVLKEVADAVGLSDAVLRDKTFVVSDSVGLADVPLKGWTPQISDSVALSDVVLRDKVLQLLDAVGLADAVLANKQLILTDAVGLAELVDVIIGAILKSVSDVVGLSDVALVDKRAVVADAIGALDVVFRHKPVLLVADVVSVVEAVLTSKLLAVVDSVALADLVVKFGESVVFTIGSRDFRQIAIVSEDFRQINITSRPFKQINISSRDLEVNAS